MWVAGLRSVVIAYIAMTMVLEDSSRASPCQQIARAIDTQAAEAEDPDVLIRLAPYLGMDAVRRLLSRAKTGEEGVAFYAYLAVGLSRHSEALRMIRESSRPASQTKRLGRALALLALGDGSDTGTITLSLLQGTAADRRRVARALSFMPQKRPRMMLYGALEDTDSQVRLSSSKVLFQVESIRARRALIDLFRNGSDAEKKRAGRVLLKSGYLFKPDELMMLAPVQRAQSMVLDAVRGRRSNLRLLGQQIRSNDDAVRTAAFASLALLGTDQTAGLRKAERLIRAKNNPDANAELLMALALMNDPSSMASLESFDRQAAERAVGVLWAFAAAGPPKSQLEPDHAGQLARAIEVWIQRGRLDEPEVARAIRSLERCDPLAGLRLARTRLGGAEGESLRTAVRVIGRSGSVSDVVALMGVAKKDNADLRSDVWRAAARVCRR
jgi:hypothetical protein